MIARLWSLLRPAAPSQGAAPAPAPDPLPPGEHHVVIAEASAHLDTHDQYTQQAHDALNRYRDTGDPRDYEVCRDLISKAAQELQRGGARLTRTQRSTRD